jgi:hypothetical protein
MNFQHPIDAKDKKQTLGMTGNGRCIQEFIAFVSKG